MGTYDVQMYILLVYCELGDVRNLHISVIDQLKYCTTDPNIFDSFGHFDLTDR